MSKKTDIWMPLVIGDYLKDTQHLDAAQHGCYLLWLMHYWTKGPLPNSLDSLVLMGRLRGADAPSIAQALLADFFRLGPDGMYHQKRADQEKTKWSDKRQKAQEKAQAAARARWGNGDAPSITPSNPSSNAQAMLNSCPSPSPVVLVDKSNGSNTSSKVRPSKAEDPRYADFLSSYRGYYLQQVKAEAPWDGQEGSALKKFLAANPTISHDQWRRLLYNRTISPNLPHAVRLSSWINRIGLSWLHGPADEWGKSITGGTNGKSTGADRQARIDAVFEEAGRRLDKK